MKKQFVYFLLFFVVPIIVVFWMMGAFATVTIEQVERGPYHYAYVTHTGRYDKLLGKQNEVYLALEAQGVAALEPITLLLSDPANTKKKELNSQTGYTVDVGAKVSAPLLVGDIPARRVLLVKVKANPVLAPSKAYEALTEYLQAHQMKLVLPTVEIYKDKEFSVEMSI